MGGAEKPVRGKVSLGNAEKHMNEYSPMQKHITRQSAI